MSAVIYASPGPVQPPSSWRPWTSMQHTWVGDNGEGWDISTRASGVMLRAGVRGMGMPDETDYWIEAAGSPGARWNGSVANKREVFWPISVFHNGGSREWIEHDARLFRTFRRRSQGTWSITNPATSETRSLRLRFKDDGGYAPETDPSLIGWTQYGLTFTAEQPYWTGATIREVWKQGGDARYFFGGGTGSDDQLGPPFYISSDKSMSTATISNPGDVDAYPVWTIAGPSTNAVVGLGDTVIQVPVTLLASEWVQIDTLAQTVLFGSSWVDANGAAVPYTDPDARANTVAGVRRSPDGLGTVAFAEVPPGEDRPLTITMSGNGTVAMDLTPLYERAWG